MKKKIISLVLIGALAVTFAVPTMGFAAIVGNTGDVKTLRGRGAFSLRETREISVESSFDMNVTLNRDLTAGDVTNLRLETGEWGMFRLGYRIRDRVEPYIRLGWAHLKAGWTDIESGKNAEITTRSGFAWGLGMKALIYEFANSNIRIVGDGSYRTADLDVEKGYFNGAKNAISKINSRFVIREWQAALLVVDDIDFSAMPDCEEALGPYRFSPYGGITYSEVNGRIRLVSVAPDTVYHPDEIKSRRNVGIVFGCDLVVQDYISLNTEVRLIDETSVSGGLAVLF